MKARLIAVSAAAAVITLTGLSASRMSMRTEPVSMRIEPAVMPFDTTFVAEGAGGVPTTSTTSIAPTTTTTRTTIPLVDAVPSHYTSVPCQTGADFDATACPLGRYVGDFTEDEIKALLVRAFPKDPVWAVKVAFCESKYDRFATNRNPDDGIMQINRPTHGAKDENGVWIVGEHPEWTWDQMHEVGPNLVIAASIYSRQGRGGWSCSRVIGMR